MLWCAVGDKGGDRPRLTTLLLGSKPSFRPVPHACLLRRGRCGHDRETPIAGPGKPITRILIDTQTC